MNIGTQQLLYRIDRTAGKFLNGLVVTGIVLATLAGIKVLLVKCGIHFDSPAWSIVLIVYKYLWWSLGGLACICVIGRIVLAPFVKSEEEEDANASLSVRAMLPMAVATSIDALAVGVTFAFLQVRVLPSSAFIGVTTFLISFAGVKIGVIFGLRYKQKAEICGGVILILLGVKILLEHLGVL